MDQLKIAKCIFEIICHIQFWKWHQGTSISKNKANPWAGSADLVRRPWKCFRTWYSTFRDFFWPSQPTLIWEIINEQYLTKILISLCSCSKIFTSAFFREKHWIRFFYIQHRFKSVFLHNIKHNLSFGLTVWWKPFENCSTV